jgi:DNA-binding PadR family transcriptional regulator
MMHDKHRAWFRHGGPRGRGFREVWGLGYNKEWGGWRVGRMRPMRRGDVKFVVLELLAEGPKHGYEIINAIEERRNIRPSAGSIYPTLQMLEDGGFVTSQEVDGKRTYTITDSGKKLLEQRETEDEQADDNDDAVDGRHQLKESAMKLGAAVLSARGSSDATIDKVREVVDRARKEIYGILATDES